MTYHLKKSMLLCLLAVVLTMALLTPAVAEVAPLTCGAWSVVSSANAESYNFLNGVAAVSTSNIWAVGYSQPNLGGPSQTLIERWNGTSWRVVSSPSPGSLLNLLNGVAAVSASNIWTVGLYFNGVYGQALIEHWDGSKWSVISSPNVKSAYNVLNGVAAISSSNIWAAGYYNSSTFIEHWNGTRWSIASSPNVGSAGNLLNGVTNVPGTRDAWTVGFYNINGGTQTLTEFRC